MRIRVGVRGEFDLCSSHAKQLLRALEIAEAVAYSDDSCEACASGLDAAFVGRMIEDLSGGPVTGGLMGVDSPIFLYYKGRTDHDWQISFPDLLARFADSAFSRLSGWSLDERFALFLTGPVDNGGLESTMDRSLFDGVIRRLTAAGFSETVIGPLPVEASISQVGFAVTPEPLQDA